MYTNEAIHTNLYETTSIKKLELHKHTQITHNLDYKMSSFLNYKNLVPQFFKTIDLPI